MSLIWLSPRLPADRSALAEDLGPGVEISSAPLPPPGTAVAVATVYERPLLERLAGVAGGGALLLLKPPGTATPLDLPPMAGPTTVAEAADVGEAARAIRGVLAGAPAPWPEAASAATASGWLLAPTESPTGELPSAAAVPAPRRGSRRHWVASGGIIGAAALAAVVVLATQGGASSTSNTGFRGPGGGLAGGYGSGNGSFGNGGFGSGGFGNGSAPGGSQVPGGGSTGSGSTGSGSTGSTDRAAQRQAFLACLSKNGVDTSSLGSGQGRPRLDPSDPTVASALQACRSLLPERGFRDGGPGGAGSDGAGPNGGMPPGGAGFPGGAGAPGSTGATGTAGQTTAGKTT